MLRLARFFSRPNFASISRLAFIMAILLLTLAYPFRKQVQKQWRVSGGFATWLLPTESIKSENFDPTENLIPLLLEYSPANSRPLQQIKRASVDLWPADNDKELMDILETTPKQILNIMEAHSGFINAIDRRLLGYSRKQPEPILRGIVTVAGSSYFPPFMVSLRLLRRTGTTLPLEVFLPEKDYEAQLCDKLLPALNAICRTFPDFNGTISHFQYKVFAILLSSFGEVLWLDADNFPLRDAAPLFASEPFQNTGLVTWPDIWQTSISPAYYLISSRSPTPVFSRASTESGQLLVSKDRHLKSLLLAAYYNYYGPEYYYPLLCQGGAGCGDKETFLPAAEAAGLPFYNVKAPARPIGHFKHNEKQNLGIYRFALIQGDPVGDYLITQHIEQHQTEVAAGSKMGNNMFHREKKLETENENLYNNVQPFFLHMSTPKWDAFHVFDHVGPYDLTLDHKKQPAAAYKDPPEISMKIQSVERMIWEETKWVACNLEDSIRHWEGKRGSICLKMQKYFDDVLDTETGFEMGLGGDSVYAPPLP